MLRGPHSAFTPYLNSNLTSCREGGILTLEMGTAIIECLTIGSPEGEYLELGRVVLDIGHLVSLHIIGNQVALRIIHLYLIMSNGMDFLMDVLSSCKKKERKYKTFIVKDSTTNLCRIAKAEDVEKRFKVLHSANPNLTLVSVIDKNVKSEILKGYEALATGQDWLSLSDCDIECIINKYTK